MIHFPKPTGVFADLKSRLRKLPRQTRGIVLAVIYGIGAALIVVGFQLAMRGIYQLGLVQLAKQPHRAFLAGSFAIVLGTSLLGGLILHFFGRDLAGSGIPQLKHAYWKDFGRVPFRVIWVKFIASALQIGGGSSLGREGPSVQLAGAVGSQLATLLGEPSQRLRRGAASGAAAGLAAAFNTPLAAVTFVLEEIIGDLNSRLLGGILFAGMLGALVVHATLGPQPAFLVAEVGEPTWRAYLLLPVVATGAALIGSAFQVAALSLRKIFRGIPAIPVWLKPSIGAMVCWTLGAAVFLKTGRLAVFGLGYEDMSEALTGGLAWQIGAILLVTKFIATVFCYGTGGCGGIFSPTLFFGAMTGLVLAGIAQPYFHLQPDELVLLAIVGMSATLGAVVRAPVTSILIVFEMTHEFALVPPLMFAALIAQAISRRLLHENFYDALLAQDGQSIERFVIPRDLQAWQEQPVIRFATTQPVVVTSLIPESVSKLLRSFSYDRFPVVQNGRLSGLLLRSEAEAAQHEKRTPRLVAALTCPPETQIRVVAEKLVEATNGIIVIQEPAGPPVSGLFTLHDLLRAQLASVPPDSLAG